MKRLLSILSLCLLTPALFASPNIFSPAQNDQSMYLLGAIFGNVGTVLYGWGSSTLMEQTFYYFNQAVLILGCIVILYSLIVSTVNTSHEGEQMGKRWSSVWIPMRSAIGFALMLPIGSGQTYAVVQAMVMWVIVQGVGAADYLWSNMVEQVVSNPDSFHADTASSTAAADTIMSAFEYYVCAMELTTMQNAADYQTNANGFFTSSYATLYANNGSVSSYNYLNNAPRVYFFATNSAAGQPNVNMWTFGFDNPQSWINESICGTITMPASTDALRSTNPALATYYDNQRNILSAALGLTQTSSGATQTPLSNTGSDGTVYNLYLPRSDNIQIKGVAPPYYVPYSSDTASYGKYIGNQAGWGKYGGNWLGDFGGGNQPKNMKDSSNTPDSRAGISAGDTTSETSPPAGSPSRNGRFKGLQIMLPSVDTTTNQYIRDNQGKFVYQLNYLPTVSYLAELLSQNIDAGSPTSDPSSPTGATGSNGSGNVDNSNTSNTASTAPTSQIIDYVEQQLALIAQAYTDASAANYAAYQSAISGTDTTKSSSKIAAGAAAAKFNGWASAGAFYLNMARILQATTSDLATTDDYSYGNLACVKDIDVSAEAHTNKMLCKDARGPADVGGQARSFNKNNTKSKGNYSTQLGSALSQSQEVTSQATGLMLNFYGNEESSGTSGNACQDTTPSPGPIQPNGQQQSPTGGYISNGTGYYYNANDPDNPYKQKCGIYNSTGNGAFSPDNFRKPRFPVMIINPLAWYHYVNGMMIYNFAQTLAPMMQMGESKTMQNPILTLRQSGIRLLNTSAKLYHAGLNYMWISGLVSFVASNWSPIFGAAMSTFSWAASMATATIAMMMAMGAILAYYFPMIPYLVFTFATIQWLILTVEAMTAAPLMALGILHPEGNHEIFGHSSMGIAMLSAIFLRPPLMIVGYFAATLMCYVVVLLINAGFFFAAGSMMSGDVSTGSVFGCVIVWMMYLNTVMIAINKAFSLIYHIPDHVTRWIGIQDAGTADVEQMMGKVQESTKQGSDMGKKVMDSSAASQGTSKDTLGKGLVNSRKKKGTGEEEGEE